MGPYWLYMPSKFWIGVGMTRGPMRDWTALSRAPRLPLTGMEGLSLSSKRWDWLRLTGISRRAGEVSARSACHENGPEMPVGLTGLVAAACVELVVKAA